MASKRSVRRMRRGNREYMWVTTQDFNFVLNESTQLQQTAVLGTDWERGGAASRETCVIKRVICNLRMLQDSVLTVPPIWACLPRLEGTTIANLTTLTANGDERWLWARHLAPMQDNFGLTGGSTFWGDHMESKASVKLSNTQSLYVVVRNSAATVNAATVHLISRVLLELSH